MADHLKEASLLLLTQKQPICPEITKFQIILALIIFHQSWDQLCIGIDNLLVQKSSLYFLITFISCKLKFQYNSFMILSVQAINKAKHYVNHSNERELDLRSKNISEIGNLTATMNYFQSIDLSNNLIKSITNISYLDRLRSLMLANNKISEIGDLGEFLPNLQNLFLMNNRVKEQQQIKNLAGCRELSTLILSNNPICQTNDYRNLVLSHLVNLKMMDFKKISIKQREQANNLTPK